MSAPTPLHVRRRLGRWTVHELQAGGQRLDGGAMFGVVPRTLWERRIAPDARNRIPLGMRCLLVEHESGLVLLDTGVGNKEDPKFYDIYGIENRAVDGADDARAFAQAGEPTLLESALAAAGFAPSDVDLVINTHLHFDHAGGNTTRTADGRLEPTFPNARYVVQGGEYAYATHTNERTAASYFAYNYVPLHEAGRLDLVDGEREIVAGIRVLPSPGHTPHHQSILLEGDAPALFVGDLVPTRWHAPLPWIMGYDVEPLVTLETKRRVLGRARAEEWLVVLEHDADVGVARLRDDGKGYVLEPAVDDPPGAL